MAQGKATVSNQNLAQGDIAGVEKTLLFIGEAELNKNQVVSINMQTDLALMFGDAPLLKTQIEAARANGGQKWQARVLVLGKETVNDELSSADIADLPTLAPSFADAQVEGLVIASMPAEGELKNLVETMQAITQTLINKYAQPMFCIVPATPYTEQTWADFVSTIDTALKDVVANRVVVTPVTHSGNNNAGILAGRLCRHDVSIADKPMRVLTGALAGLGDPVALSEGHTLSSADLETLDSKRMSVPQDYIGYPGMYWGDANSLDAPGNDFTLLEHTRIADFAARRIRIKAIPMIGDRAINSTPASMTYTKNEFMTVLNKMARAFVINGKQVPGLIKPTTDESINLVWKDRKTMDVYFKLTPFESPVEINGHIALDLSDPQTGEA